MYFIHSMAVFSQSTTIESMFLPMMVERARSLRRWVGVARSEIRPRTFPGNRRIREARVSLNFNCRSECDLSTLAWRSLFEISESFSLASISNWLLFLEGWWEGRMLILVD